MIQTQTQESPHRSRQEIEAHLVAKAWKDENFKQELLNNSKVIIQKEFGVELPEQLNVRVMEEDANTLYITLPMPPIFAGAELSDQELEAIAGGASPVAAIGAVAGVIGITWNTYNFGKESVSW